MLRNSSRLSRLMLAMALLYIWLLSVGGRTIRAGLRHFVDRKDRRGLSIFQIGLHFIDRCLLNSLRSLYLYSFIDQTNCQATSLLSSKNCKNERFSFTRDKEVGLMLEILFLVLLFVSFSGYILLGQSKTGWRFEILPVVVICSQIAHLFLGSLFRLLYFSIIVLFVAGLAFFSYMLLFPNRAKVRSLIK